MNVVEELGKALAELESYSYESCCNDRCIEEAGQARAKIFALVNSTITTQVDDPLIECYRLAITNKAPAEHLESILNMIKEREGGSKSKYSGYNNSR
jgi:hypothetical protein